jgi:branched-chain amino acid transport system permease protein
MRRAEPPAGRWAAHAQVLAGRVAWLWVPAAGVAVLVLLAQMLPPYWEFLGISAVVSSVALLGLGVVSGSAGMISLCQMSFAAVGGWVVAKLSEVSFPGGLLAWIGVGGLAAVPFGILIGLPALRLRGVHLAVVTLGFAAAGDSVLQQIGFPGSAQYRPITRPALFASDRSYFLMSGCVLIVIAVALTAVSRRRAGAAWRVVRFSERATAAAGYSVARTKLTAFAISAFVAGISGGLLAGQVGLLSAQSFSVSQSLLLYVLAMMLGAQYVDGAVAGGVLGVLVTALLTRFNVNQNWAGVLFGAGAVQALATGSSLGEDVRLRLAARQARGEGGEPPGLAPMATPAASAAVPALSASAAAPRPAAPRPAAPRPAPGAASRPAPGAAHSGAPAAPLLAMRGLSVRYGAVAALTDVDLDVPPGVVMGLIGPNGAGKSTLADAVTGFIGHAEGTVELGGLSLAGRSVRARARAGLRRTFQQNRVPPSLTVGEYVRFASGCPRSQDRVREVLGYLGCPPPEQPIRRVDAGTRRLLEIVGILLSEPRLVILDEPAAGLGRAGSEFLGERLAAVPATFGASLLLIEHDLDLIRACCSTVAVLDFGKVIAAGEPADVLSRAAVTAAYLGDLGAVP